jgi:predicted oxidoreductase
MARVRPPVHPPLRPRTCEARADAASAFAALRLPEARAHARRARASLRHRCRGVRSDDRRLQPNRGAREGRDPAFGRGETPYNRVQGDPGQGPNPCVAPLEHAPYYAVEVVPGGLGTFAGLRTDARARVLDRAGNAVPGLYACGNDMNSIMGGRYPSDGITLGPAMTFGYVAAHDAAGVIPGEAPSTAARAPAHRAHRAAAR